MNADKRPRPAATYRAARRNAIKDRRAAELAVKRKARENSK